MNFNDSNENFLRKAQKLEKLFRQVQWWTEFPSSECSNHHHYQLRWRLEKRNRMFEKVYKKRKSSTTPRLSSLFPFQFALNIRARKVHATDNPSPKKRKGKLFFARNLHEKRFLLTFFRFLGLKFSIGKVVKLNGQKDSLRTDINLRLCLSVEQLSCGFFSSL